MLALNLTDSLSDTNKTVLFTVTALDEGDIALLKSYVSPVLCRFCIYFHVHFCNVYFFLQTLGNHVLRFQLAVPVYNCQRGLAASYMVIYCILMSSIVGQSHLMRLVSSLFCAVP